MNEGIYIVVVTALFLLTVMLVATLNFPGNMGTSEPQPVYFLPAGAPDSIPCSSEIDSRCMIYVRKDV